MCLIVLAWHILPGMPLIAAANRDEFYDRPTAAAAWWTDHDGVYAGRDLRDGGTWMGVTRDGRFAAVTNFRSNAEKKSGAPSRGLLAADYLTGKFNPKEYIAEISADAERYNGFNLLIGDSRELIWFSNGVVDDPRNGQPLTPGIYGLSNGALDAPWPKIVKTKAQFASLLCQGAPQDAFFEMLTDTTPARDCRLPKTGISLEWERALSAVFIESPKYGTRSSTVVRLLENKEAILEERLMR